MKTFLVLCFGFIIFYIGFIFDVILDVHNVLGREMGVAGFIIGVIAVCLRITGND